MADKNRIEPAADFQALPLEMIVATPLTAAVKAQRAAAEATLAFIKAFIDDKTNKPISMTLEVETDSPPALPEDSTDPQRLATSIPPGGASTPAPQPPVPSRNSVRITAPLLAMVQVPQLRIDSMTVNFKYEVSQTYLDKNQTSGSLNLETKTGAALSPWVSASLQGSVSSSRQEETTVHRGGSLDITVRASEAPMPAGLDRLLTLLSRSIPGSDPK